MLFNLHRKVIDYIADISVMIREHKQPEIS
jgi:hypothetical protein